MRIYCLILLLLSCKLVTACSCESLGNFFKAAEASELVVKVKVMEKLAGANDFNEKMRVQLIETFKGDEERKFITILGDDGDECRPYIDYFNVGDVCYLALFNYQDEYELSICGEFYLKVIEGVVEGDRNDSSELATVSGLTENQLLKRLVKNK